jgi:GAF domain-containing protein
MTSLQQVLEASRDLFAAGGAGFMMIDAESSLTTVAWTDDSGRALEQRQQQIGEGPCVDTLSFDHVVTTEDLRNDDRWPTLIAELPDCDVRALIGVPVRIGGGAIGALNIYRDRPHEWHDSERAALEAYARLVESFLTAGLEAREREELAEQLQHALDHRVPIERAVGVIMARERINAVAAFNRLRSTARSAQRKVVDIANELLDEVSEDQ